MPSIYDRVFAEIVAEIDRTGALPWVKPWRAAGGAVGLPHNAVTGRRYTGGNVLALWASAATHGYDAPAWLTFQQARAARGNVRKGEKASAVYFMRAIDGTDVETEQDRRQFFAWLFFVFNVDQCDGLDAYRPAVALGPAIDPIASCETFVSATGAIVVAGGRAAYDPAADVIEMPRLDRFDVASDYYGTLFHELTHWTGHPSRLDRLRADATYGTAQYAGEELVAELGASFLAAEHGIAHVTRAASYLANWLKAIKDDPHALAHAASLAQRAVDHLHTLAGTTPATLPQAA